MERLRARAQATASPSTAVGPSASAAQADGLSAAHVAAFVGAANRLADAAGSLEAIDPDSVVGRARPSTVASHAARGFEESGSARRNAQNSLGLNNA